MEVRVWGYLEGSGPYLECILKVNWDVDRAAGLDYVLIRR